MIKKNVVLLAVLTMIISFPVSATTLLQYDFETDVNGVPGVAGGLMNESGVEQETILDVSSNGNNMWVLGDSTTLAFSGDTPYGVGLSMECTGSPNHGYTSVDSALATWSPVEWTIECSAKINNLNGWHTMVGRDLSSAGGSEADLYLQKNDIDDRFRINYYTVGGVRRILDSEEVAVAGEWYNIAITSDGTELVMYIDALDGNGYQAVSVLDMTDDTPANNAIATLEDNWTFGRGYYGGSVDYLPGFLDNVRFLDTSVMPASAPSPSPINADGSIGEYQEVDETIDLTLNFKAAIDPNNVVDDSVTAHHIYMSTAEDANIAYYATVPADGSDVSLAVEDLAPDTTYYWAVEEAVGGGSAGSAGNIMGMTWSFTTSGPAAVIGSGPADSVAKDGDITLSVSVSPSTLYCKWYKVVGEPDIDGAETDDVELSETSIELVIAGATLADEGRYYCVAFNKEDQPSDPSRVAYAYTQRLIGHWNFEDNLEDSILASIPGAPVHDGSIVTVADGALSYQAGMDGQAVVFNNDGDYVAIADSEYFNFFTDEFTVNIWYKSVGTAGWSLMLAKLDPGMAGWLLGTAGDDICQFIIDVPFARIDSNAEIDINDGQWHMLTLTYNSVDEELACYTDGARSGVISDYVIGNNAPNAPLTIGAIENGASVYAAIDDVRIYSDSLTQAEVADLYLAMNPDAEFCFSNFVDEFDYDFNDDCQVDILDFAMFTDEWLECQLYPADLCAP